MKLELFPSSSLRSGMPRRHVRYNNFIFTIVFLLLALSSSPDDDMWLPAFLVVA